MTGRGGLDLMTVGRTGSESCAQLPAHEARTVLSSSGLATTSTCPGGITLSKQVVTWVLDEKTSWARSPASTTSGHRSSLRHQGLGAPCVLLQPNQNSCHGYCPGGNHGSQSPIDEPSACVHYSRVSHTYINFQFGFQQSCTV